MSPFLPRPAAVLLDAGYTLIFPDPERIAAAARDAGVAVAAAALEAAEEPMRRQVAGYGWATAPGSVSPTDAGARFFARYLELAGAAPDAAAAGGAAVWAAHLRQNVWARVGGGVAGALARLRDAGLRLAVVSNSEGTVEAVLHEVGLGRFLDTVVDSWAVGVSKPDPAIFRIALDRLALPAAAALMVGDTPATDVDGARAAGIRAVLVDRFGLYPGHDGPRFRDVGEVVDALLA
jgi:putative hydrolase of the HAD superfamily